jgi:hypothetical protein
MTGTRIEAASEGGPSADEALRRDDELCRVAGDLVERGVPGGRPSLTAARRDQLQVALAGGDLRSPSGARRRRFLVPALAALGVVALGGAAAVRLLAARPIAFEVEGAEVGPGGWVETAAARPATVRFSDGTAVALGGSSAARVTARTPEGATFTVERGRARFEVVHRARTHWLVAAGPFEILVTGTAFDVAWSAERGHALAVELRAGSVIVRGSLAGAGIPLRAGQRLVADLDRGALSVAGGTSPPGVVEAAGARATGAAGASAGAEPGAIAPTPTPTPTGELASTPAPLSDPTESSDDRTARAEREKARLARAASPAPPAFPAPERGALARGAPPPSLGPALAPAPAPSRQLVEPEPWPDRPPVSDANPAAVKLAAGGSACVGWAPQVRFDRSPERVEVASVLSLAFSHPVLDRARSWCGAGSLRVDARFDLSGTPNRLGNRPRHAGEVLVDLPAAIDLTGKTVTVHFFVEGPPDIRFGAQLFAVNRAGSRADSRADSSDPKWVGGGFTPDLTTGRWWTLSHTFERENRLFEGGTSPVDRVDKVTLQVYAIGKDRVWTGRVFVDDLGWQ